MRHIYALSARRVLGDERQTHICICRSRTAATPSRKPRSKASVSPWRSTIAAFILPRGFQPTPGKISDAVTRVIDLLYGETATGSAADVLAERHLPVAARRFPRAYPLEPGLWRNLLDDDRAFAWRARCV